MAGPFDRAWDFMKNDEEDPNTTDNIDPNRSSRIMDIFSGLGPARRGKQTKHEGQPPQLPTKFSDFTPSKPPRAYIDPNHEHDIDSNLIDVLEQIRQGGKPNDIYGSPPYGTKAGTKALKPYKEGHDEIMEGHDEIMAKPPTEAFSRYQESLSGQYDDRPHMRKPKLGQGLLDRAKANNVTNPGSTRYQGKPEEGDAGEDKPEKPDGDKDE